MKSQKASSVRRKYDDEFKLQALKLVESGQSVRSVAQNLGISENLLHHWKKPRYANSLALELENAQLKAKLKQVEIERDLLKNVWLRRRSQPQNESLWPKAGRMQQMYPASLL
jgi:transposase